MTIKAATIIDGVMHVAAPARETNCGVDWDDEGIKCMWAEPMGGVIAPSSKRFSPAPTGVLGAAAA
jgi:hypothetical protein